jgi:hypothetical protein
MTKNIEDRKTEYNSGILIRILFLLFLVYYSVMSLLAPVRKKDALYGEYGFVQDESNSINEKIIKDSTYLSLLKQKSFLQAKLAMAETDSVYLTVSIPDSMVNLEISGLTVHSSHIAAYRMSRLLRKGNEYIMTSMLSEPLTIRKSYSTIPREPIMKKMAPRDTSEYRPDIIPDTAEQKPVFFILEFDKGLRLLIYQDERGLYPGDRFVCFSFVLWQRIRMIFEDLKKVFLFKVPEYHPFIKIRIPASDARIIYRALPLQGQTGLYI